VVLHSSTLLLLLRLRLLPLRLRDLLNDLQLLLGVEVFKVVDALHFELLLAVLCSEGRRVALHHLLGVLIARLLVHHARVVYSLLGGGGPKELAALVDDGVRVEAACRGGVMELVKLLKRALGNLLAAEALLEGAEKKAGLSGKGCGLSGVGVGLGRVRRARKICGAWSCRAAGGGEALARVLDGFLAEVVAKGSNHVGEA
jgi:hypothetical protein